MRLTTKFGKFILVEMSCIPNKGTLHHSHQSTHSYTHGYTHSQVYVQFWSQGIHQYLAASKNHTVCLCSNRKKKIKTDLIWHKYENILNIYIILYKTGFRLKK